MLLQVREPELHRLGVAVPDLDKAAQGNALVVLLRLLVDEMGPRDRPALDNARQGHGAKGGQAQVVGGAQGKVGEELEVGQSKGAQLQIAGRDTVLAFTAQRLHIQGLHGAGEAGVERAVLDGLSGVFGCFRRGRPRYDVKIVRIKGAEWPRAWGTYCCCVGVDGCEDLDLVRLCRRVGLFMLDIQ